MDDPTADTKSVDDMVFDEVDHISGLTSTSSASYTHFEK